jgi:hypothetical protein
MKTQIAVGKFVVSFNTRFGEYEIGEADMNSLDYAGDDVDALAAEVIADDADPSFPLLFKAVNEGDVIGKFIDATYPDEDCPVAIMVNRSAW